MRVLHYIPSMKAVAASAFLGYKLDLLRLMSERMEVTVLTPDAGGVRLDGIRIVTLPALRIACMRRKGWTKLLYKLGPDIVHIHVCGGISAYRLSCACRDMGIPVLVSLDRRLAPWHASCRMLSGWPVSVGYWGRAVLSYAMALHAVCCQEYDALRVMGRSFWHKGTGPFEEKVVEIDAFNITGGTSASGMLDSMIALYRKMADTLPFPRMNDDERYAEDVLITLGASEGRVDVKVADEKLPVIRSFGTESWRRIFLHSFDEGVIDYLMAGTRILRLNVPEGLETGVTTLERFGQCDRNIVNDNIIRNARAMRRLRSDDSVKDVELEVCSTVVETIIKVKHSCVRRADFVQLYRVLRFTDYDECRVEAVISSLGLLKQSARLMRVMEEHYGLTEGFMFTQPLDDRGTDTLRNKLFKSGIQ